MVLASGLAGSAVQAVSGWATGVNGWVAGFVSVQPGDYDPSTGHGPEWGKAAPAGLLIWLFLGTALFFLVKSMNRHIKRVPKSFSEDGVDGLAAVGDGDSADDSAVDDSAVGDSEESDMTLSSTSADTARPGPE